MIFSAHLCACVAVAVAVPNVASAQSRTTRDTMGSMPMSAAADTTKPMTMEMADPIGVPMTRTGSGTTWLPDRSPMHAKHLMAGGWELMLHGLAFVQYDKQYSDRGDTQFGAPNWGMLMATRPLGTGRLQLRAMMSLDPFTLTSRGYPLLLQSGEAFQGQPLHDRQHPHDLFMEMAAIYEHPLANNLGLQLYLAPVGEPATGPVAFPHRPSASSDPLAPLGHHWQDATHISFGVATAALYTRSLKLEGSIFNGREPDEIRTNFDYKGRSLDSYAGRLTVNPTADVSISGSYAYLNSPEALHPEISQHRITASALYGRTFGEKGEWSSALIYGANQERGGNAGGSSALSNSVLAETNVDLDGTNTVFGRAEFVQKSAADLAVDAAEQPGIAAFASTTPDTRFNVGSLVLGYVREIGRFTGGSIGLGVRGSVNVIPSTLEPAYGTRTPAGFSIFVRFRPNRMAMGAHGGMHMNEGAHAAGHAADTSAMSSMPGMSRDSARFPRDTTMRMDSSQAAPPAKSSRDTSMASMSMPMSRRADSASHPMPSTMPAMPGMPAMDTMPMVAMAKLHERMMADPVIRRRVLGDTVMRRLMTEMIGHMPADHQAMMRRMMRDSAPSRGAKPSHAPTHQKKPVPATKRPPADSAKKGAAHDKMPGMKMPPQR